MMKKIVVLMALVAFTVSAPAHCGDCGAGDKADKECCGKEEGKCCKDSKDDKHDHSL